MKRYPSLKVRHVDLGTVADQREDTLELSSSGRIVEGCAAIFVLGVHMATLANHELQAVQVATEEE